LVFISNRILFPFSLHYSLLLPVLPYSLVLSGPTLSKTWSGSRIPACGKEKGIEIEKIILEKGIYNGLLLDNECWEVRENTIESY
tara:strand:- start:403 stop:657 length:255 start_codon:yes stop_codon:yes gene_type:complete